MGRKERVGWREVRISSMDWMERVYCMEWAQIVFGIPCSEYLSGVSHNVRFWFLVLYLHLFTLFLEFSFCLPSIL